METLKIRYLSDKIEKLRFIDGKSDWIDLRSAEEVNMKAGEAQSYFSWYCSAASKGLRGTCCSKKQYI